MLADDEITKCLEILEIYNVDIQSISLKLISTAFQRLALKLHPDKAGDQSTAAFQSLHEAYEKVRGHLKNHLKDDFNCEKNFFDDNFEAFNFPFENQGSFTVKIQDTLAQVWNQCISKLLGSP